MQHSWNCQNIEAWSQNHWVFCYKQLRETRWEKKTQNNCQIWEELNVKLPGTHYPPALSYSSSTRCSILRDMAKVRKAETQPLINKTHKLKRQDWAKKYLETFFSKVLWTDEMRLTLDEPDGWANDWYCNGHRAPLQPRHQQSGGGVLVWAVIIKDELVGPFRVEDGLKLNSQFLEETFFKQWYRKKSASFKITMIFMQDHTPSHTSKHSTLWLASKSLKDERIMTWPPSSPDLNPIENLWALRDLRFTEKENSTPLWTVSGRLWLLRHKKLIVNRSRNWQTPWMEDF